MKEWKCQVCGKESMSLVEIMHSPAMCSECWDNYLLFKSGPEEIDKIIKEQIDNIERRDEK
jgi:hypothetical protein